MHTPCVDTFLRPSCVNKKGRLDVRDRSEFPQYQTFQRYVRVVVLGVRLCAKSRLGRVATEDSLCSHRPSNSNHTRPIIQRIPLNAL